VPEIPFMEVPVTLFGCGRYETRRRDTELHGCIDNLDKELFHSRGKKLYKKWKEYESVERKTVYNRISVCKPNNQSNSAHLNLSQTELIFVQYDVHQ